MKKVYDGDKELRIIDQQELQEALDENVITTEQYHKAYNVANQLMSEIQNGTNIFINRGLTDYLNIKA